MPRRQIPHRAPSGTRYTPESLILALPTSFTHERCGFDEQSPIRGYLHRGGIRPQHVPSHLNAWMPRAEWRRLAEAAGWIISMQRTVELIEGLWSVTLYGPEVDIEATWDAFVALVREPVFAADLTHVRLFPHPREARQAVYINRAGYRVFGGEVGSYLLGYAYRDSETTLRFNDGSRVTVDDMGYLLIYTLGPEIRQTYARITGLGYDGTGWDNPELSSGRMATPPSPDTLSDALTRVR